MHHALKNIHFLSLSCLVVAIHPQEWPVGKNKLILDRTGSRSISTAVCFLLQPVFFPITKQWNVMASICTNCVPDSVVWMHNSEPLIKFQLRNHARELSSWIRKRGNSEQLSGMQCAETLWVRNPCQPWKNKQSLNAYGIVGFINLQYESSIEGKWALLKGAFSRWFSLFNVPASTFCYPDTTIKQEDNWDKCCTGIQRSAHTVKKSGPFLCDDNLNSLCFLCQFISRVGILDGVIRNVFKEISIHKRGLCSISNSVFAVPVVCATWNTKQSTRLC